MTRPASPESKRVILFRTPSPDDAYISTFRRAGYDPTCIPVLIEAYETDGLAELLRDGGDGWDGVVLSSKRGAEGWVRAVKEIDTVRGSGWSSVPLYAVGNSTLDALSSCNLPKHLLPDLTDDRVAKSAMDLIPLLMSPTSRTSNGQSKGCLIVRGDKSLDQISGALLEASRPYMEVIVYRTSEDPNLRQRLEGLDDKGWIVFFAPSSAEIVLSYLVKGHDGHSGTGYTIKQRRMEDYRIAAIGQTTRRFLEDQGLEVDATAESPDALGLLLAMQQADI